MTFIVPAGRFCALLGLSLLHKPAQLSPPLDDSNNLVRLPQDFDFTETALAFPRTCSRR